MPIGILGLGSWVPDLVVDNAAVSTAASTTIDWIERATGIETRRYADPATPTSVLGRNAVDDLLRRRPDALDGLGTLIVATSTPDQPQPATAAILQGGLARDLQLGPVATFDVNSVCTGCVTALVIGVGLAGQPFTGPRVLVVAADQYSKIVDRTDRKTAAIFGDGAGVILLGAVPDGFGIRAWELLTHGELADYVYVAGGGTRQPLDADALASGADRFRMQGRLVRDYVLATAPGLIKRVLVHAHLAIGDVDRWIFHQGNPRLVGSVVDALGVDPLRVPITADVYGNTGAASIPITLAHADAKEPLRTGENIVLVAFGGGMTEGVMACTWWNDHDDPGATA